MNQKNLTGLWRVVKRLSCTFKVYVEDYAKLTEIIVLVN